jgi:hypothetical protein
MQSPNIEIIRCTLHIILSRASRVQSSFKSFQSTLINYWLWFKIIDFIDYDFINFVSYSECYTSLHESVPIASEHLRCLAATCFKQDGGQNKMSR